tara:strand:- start:105 stop:1058 length:954 start_codon:yes stop_codon:yes gene_type:complete
MELRNKITDEELESIKTLKDLIKVVKHKDNEDCKNVVKIEKELKELDNLIGLKELKEQILNQIMFFVQGFGTDEMMHTALLGPPGVGKTTVARLIGKIYAKLGFLSEGEFRLVGREDLIGQFLGETAEKTRCVLEDARGSVLFIDEAYALGNNDGKDSYSKECLDTINRFLSENTKDFVCIVAGYEEDMEKCFFSLNKGLNRRFPWRYVLKPYKNDHLYEMCVKMIKKEKWRIPKDPGFRKNLREIFERNEQLFKNNGGDVNNFVVACKMAHSKRSFGKDKSIKKILINKDLDKGLKIYKSNKKEDKKCEGILHMYI